MVTFKELIRNKRPNGFYPVYIRIVYRSRMGYIKTDKVVTKYIDRMRGLGLERNAKNYRLAVNHLERFVDSNKIMFSFLTSTVLTAGWKV